MYEECSGGVVVGGTWRTEDAAAPRREKTTHGTVTGTVRPLDSGTGRRLLRGAPASGATANLLESLDCYGRFADAAESRRPRRDGAKQITVSFLFKFMMLSHGTVR